MISHFKRFRSDDYRAMGAAKEGDYGPLIKILRTKDNPSPEILLFVADLLEGKVKRPRHRQPRLSTQALYLQMAGHVRSYGRKQMAGINSAAKHFGCSERTIKTALRAERRFFRRMESLADPDGWVKFEDLGFVQEIFSAMKPNQ